MNFEIIVGHFRIEIRFSTKISVFEQKFDSKIFWLKYQFLSTSEILVKNHNFGEKQNLFQ